LWKKKVFGFESIFFFKKKFTIKIEMVVSENLLLAGRSAGRYKG
jgi:hypothetical protein